MISDPVPTFSPLLEKWVDLGAGSLEVVGAMTGPLGDLSSCLPEEAERRLSEAEGEPSRGVEGPSEAAEPREIGDETSSHCK